MFRIGILTGVVFIIGIIAYGYRACKTNAQAAIPPSIQLEQLQLEELNGKKIRLGVGNPRVISFWLTSCKTCTEAFPQFDELQEIYAGKVEFIMVSDETAAAIQNFQLSEGYALTMARSTKPFKQYGLKSAPATFFYDYDGKLIDKYMGSLSKEELNQKTELLLYGL